MRFGINFEEDKDLGFIQLLKVKRPQAASLELDEFYLLERTYPFLHCTKTKTPLVEN